MNIKFKSIILPIFIISLSIIFTLILILNKEEAEKLIISKPKISIETFKVKKRNYRIHIEAESEIQPKLQYTITPHVSGEIVYVSDYLDNNLVFKEGDLLIQIDSSDYSIARINAKARLDAAMLDYKLKKAASERSQEELNTYNYNKATDLAKKIPQLKSSKSLLDAAEANYKKALLDLARTSILAPFNGRVERNFITKGVRVSGFDKLATIYSTDAFKIEFPVSISDVEYLGIIKDEAGFIQDANIKIEIQSKIGQQIYRYKGKYIGISGSIDRLTQTIKLNALLDRNNINTPIDKGEFAESKIYGKTYKDVYVIPNQAINSNDEVYIVDNDILIKKEVEVLKSYKDSTIIKSGLKNGDILNITPISIYVDSMRINILEK